MNKGLESESFPRMETQTAEPCAPLPISMPSVSRGALSSPFNGNRYNSLLFFF